MARTAGSVDSHSTWIHFRGAFHVHLTVSTTTWEVERYRYDAYGRTHVLDSDWTADEESEASLDLALG